MKKITMIAAALVLMLTGATAQTQSPTDALFDKYGAKDGFTTVHITKELFSLFAEVTQEAEGDDMQELNKVVQGLDFIRILMLKDTVQSRQLTEFRNELNGVKLKDFSELMTVNEGGESVKFMIRKNGKNINELLLIINQPKEAGFISITGNIDLKTIAKLSKSMNIDGMENLDKIK
ncbi:MAG: DUF4252 domain-containing protein [Bacteroidales bacterium]|jgi:hypothetical protein|nr:DUF4252 domain-containing protein [Bacteroidales bacterium]MDD2631820.1 DUF4252 domain-containing protein [Bacteroidales bacterium]MDD4741483.1 DUF4252 domain-containing protein [Bacteroidales bacterium]NCU36187.1 DUF4252 domain-containing protein [Candidatus Falkowbacteria bacterium]NLO51915.1 DUF4252 domain-containing protein [Bacteroidales bacterium]